MGRSTSPSRSSSSWIDADAEIVSPPTSGKLRRGLSDPAHFASSLMQVKSLDLDETPKASNLRRGISTPGNVAALEKLHEEARQSEMASRKASRSRSKEASRSRSKEKPRRRSKDKSPRRQNRKEAELGADEDQKLLRLTNSISSADGIKAPDDLDDLQQRESEEEGKSGNRSKFAENDEKVTKIYTAPQKESPSLKMRRSKSLDCDTLDVDNTMEKAPRPSIQRMRRSKSLDCEASDVDGTTEKAPNDTEPNQCTTPLGRKFFGFELGESIDADTELNQCMTRPRSKSTIELDDSIDTTDKAKEPFLSPLTKPPVDQAFDPGFSKPKPVEKRNKTVKLNDQILGEMEVAKSHEGSHTSQNVGASIVSLDSSNCRRVQMEVHETARTKVRSISPRRPKSSSVLKSPMVESVHSTATARNTSGSISPRPSSSWALKSLMSDSVQSPSNGGDWGQDPVEAFKINDPKESFKRSRCLSADGMSKSASPKNSLRHSKTCAEIDKPKRRSKSTEDPFDQRVHDAFERKRDKRKSSSNKSKKHREGGGDEVKILDVSLSDLLAAAMSEIDAPVVPQPQRAQSMHGLELQPSIKIGLTHSSNHERRRRHANDTLPGNELMSRSDHSQIPSRETSSFLKSYRESGNLDAFPSQGIPLSRETSSFLKSFTTDGAKSGSDDWSPEGTSFDFERYVRDECI